MLKWTASAQKLNQLTPSIKAATTTLRSPHPLTEAKRRRRRATINNKENIVPYTSTPMVAQERNSLLVPSPLTDIWNVTPKTLPPLTERTPERMLNASTSTTSRPLPNRRHSTMGFFLHSAPTYASTLPRFEEEYSPSTVLPTGQQVALRGLLPDPFLSNLRYFNTPELEKRKQKRHKKKLKAARKSLPRKLEADCAEIARECCGEQQTKRNYNEPHSAGMSDQTLDKLIDAILDSARKGEKKKVRPRKSFNLRRRTLIKNQTEQKVSELVLSPSYAPGDDPASDLSFLLTEPVSNSMMKVQGSTKASPPTPAPATPLPGTPVSEEILQKMPTPVTNCMTTSACTAQLHFLRSSTSKERLDTTFTLETPVRLPMQRKRQRRKTLAVPIGGSTKRFKADGSKNYYDVGLALPSIYI